MVKFYAYKLIPECISYNSVHTYFILALVVNYTQYFINSRQNGAEKPHFANFLSPK